MVRNKNPEKSQQEARRGKMSFFAYFKEEFQVIQERDPAIHSPMEVLLYPSFRVMLKYRRAHKLYLKGHYFLARWISQRAARKTGIENPSGMQTIGKGLFIESWFWCDYRRNSHYRRQRDAVSGRDARR